MTQAAEALDEKHNALAQDLLIRASHYLRPDELRAMQNAVRMAQFVFGDAVRRSGETFFEHSIAVAEIVLEYNLDPETLTAAVLHDVVQYADVTVAQVRENFGAGVAGLVDGVTMLSSLPEKTREEKQAENLRKLILATSSDVRVMLLRLSDRLHNMRTVHRLPPERQTAMARETMEIYAPIAGRLGMSKMRAELEDLAFKVPDPDAFESIEAKLSETRAGQQRRLDDIRQQLLVELRRHGIKVDNNAITSRQKHVYSLHEKMQRNKYQEADLWRIYDRLGIRVIVPSVPDCYQVLGVVHSLWKAVPDEFDDYISRPRPTGYRSLHTAVQYNPEDSRDIVEIQIRTPDMHEEAEYGIAAHWRYKEGAQRDVEFENKVAWLRQLLELGAELQDAEEFVDAMKTDVFADRVYVFTPARGYHRPAGGKHAYRFRVPHSHRDRPPLPGRAGQREDRQPGLQAPDRRQG
ncbi:MAG: HD domain-containing protein [Anaerolineae bacterium]|nr:HD domain-containing protein [Anaerolineae bacterium]